MTQHYITQPGAAQTRPVLIEIILDETGSMSSCKNQAISGYNTFLKEQREQPNKALLTLTKFDSNGLRTPYRDLDLAFVPDLTSDTFLPGSMTNLYDALGTRIDDIAHRVHDFTIKPMVLVVVITDGQDNASRIYSQAATRQLVETYTAQNWCFAYLGADARALQTAAALGISPGNAKAFDVEAFHETMETLSRGTTAYRAGTQTALFT
jgi:hypothetical protein